MSDQSPERRPRALDHIVVPCTDLAAAARTCEALGFVVGRRNRHDWGTENHIIQVPGAFIELIALAPDYAPLAPEDDAFPFAGFLAGQGASAAPSGMVVLRSSDADGDVEAFAAAGLGTGRGLHFSRTGAAPDGTTRTVTFSLAFAASAAMRDVGFFTCQQHNPENFWNAAMQRHPNGATAIAAVVLAAERPADHAPFLQRFAGAPTADRSGDGLSIPLDSGAAIRVDQAAGPARLTGLVIKAPGPARRQRMGQLDLIFEG